MKAQTSPWTAADAREAVGITEKKTSKIMGVFIARGEVEILRRILVRSTVTGMKTWKNEYCYAHGFEINVVHKRLGNPTLCKQIRKAIYIAGIGEPSGAFSLQTLCVLVAADYSLIARMLRRLTRSGHIAVIGKRKHGTVYYNIPDRDKYRLEVLL